MFTLRSFINVTLINIFTHESRYCYSAS